MGDPSTDLKSWPGGKRIAVAVTVMFETWSEGKWPRGMVSRGSLKADVTDNQAITWTQYGGRTGVWRLVRILDDVGVPATFCTNALSADTWPDAVKRIVRSGHDIGAHGYAQEQVNAHMTPEEERASIKRSLDVLGEHSGARPLGWLTSGLCWTEHTDRFLTEEKLLWRGDANYLDLPRRVSTPNGPIAHIPHCDYTDHRMLHAPASAYFDTNKATFDYLYEHEPMSLMIVTAHCHIGGRPLGAAMFDKVLRYIAGFDGVWFVRHQELARWALARQDDEVSNAKRFFPA